MAALTSCFAAEDILKSVAADTLPGLTEAGVVLVTGASGFIGQKLVTELAAAGVTTRAALRQGHAHLPGGVEVVEGVSLDASYDWRPALSGCRTVIHTAALVHCADGHRPEVLETYRRVNVLGTLRLAHAAAEAGARRFIFLSSIKVNGETTSRGAPFSSVDPPAPVGSYAISKAEAEQELRNLASSTGVEVVIIRPVLAYGPGVKGNFRSLLRLLTRGLPLPLGAVRNRRSLVGVRNLTSLILTCATHRAAANATFLVSDGDDLSTTELLTRTARALGRRVPLVPVPTTALRVVARATGRSDIARRLLDSLQVDISRTKRLLNWTPPLGVDEELSATARWFLRYMAARG